MNNEMPIRAAPYAHQISAFEFAKLRNATALLMEMGTGKSLTAIAIAGRLYLNKKIQRVLVVAPLSILGVWQEEFSKFADFDYSLSVLTGTLAKKAATLKSLQGTPLQVAVVNYESTWRLEKEITAWKPELIICDEGHKLKNHTTATSKSLYKAALIGSMSGFLPTILLAQQKVEQNFKNCLLSAGRVMWIWSLQNQLVVLHEIQLHFLKRLEP